MIEHDPYETTEQRRNRLNRQAVREEIRQLRAKAKSHALKAWDFEDQGAAHYDRMAYNSYSLTATILEQQLDSQQ
ncbi:hypothetical protein BABAYKA_00170 [Brevundimonas phage vB_BpoS-Babayka]|uniref:Uncharacterized protein n=1 Tax=Brevundimonas phage vB_BpoS-Babayka TaxID=2948596 RepID=A0A9E7MVF5_9CAUD|nr:hypothetical protein BABAYKA_00170 [Brevundimonas phage vB_BpoS-Babayka]